MPNGFDDDEKRWPEDRLYMTFGIVFVLGLALAVLIGWLVR